MGDREEQGSMEPGCLCLSRRRWPGEVLRRSLRPKEGTRTGGRVSASPGVEPVTGALGGVELPGPTMGAMDVSEPAETRQPAKQWLEGPEEGGG